MTRGPRIGEMPGVWATWREACDAVVDLIKENGRWQEESEDGDAGADAIKEEESVSA